MNPIDLPREIQDLIVLPDDEIKERLKQNAKLVSIFHTLKEEQVSHVQKSLADRFLHIIEDTDIDPAIKRSLVGVFRDIGGIGIDLPESKLEELFETYSSDKLIANWSYFSENNKKQILFILVRRNDFGILLHLIQNVDVDLNVFTADGTHFLQYVYHQILQQKDAFQSHFVERMEIITLLIKKGADLNAKSKNEETLLEKMIIEGDDFLVGEIVKLGANPNAVDKEGNPLIYLAYRLATERPESSSEEDDTRYDQILEILLGMDNLDLTIPNQEGCNLFQLAFKINDNLTVEQFLNHPSISEADKNGYWLILAILYSNWNEVGSLLKKESINLSVKDAKKLTVLHYLCAQKTHTKEVIELLTRVRPDVNSKDNEGTTPLHLSFGDGDIEVVEVLLELGAQQDVLDSNGEPPIHYLYSTQQYERIEQLFKYNLFNPNVRDKQGRTILQRACQDGNKKLVKFLLGHPSIDLYFEDNYIEHVVDMANFLSDPVLIKMVIEHPKIKEADRNGYKLFLACQNKNWNEALDLLQQEEINPNFTDASKKSPLLMAYEAANLKVVQALLKREEIDPNIKDGTGRLLLFGIYQRLLIVKGEQQEFEKQVLESFRLCKHTDLNRKDKDGSVLIHLAFLRRDNKLLKALLEDERVDPNIPDTMGRFLLTEAFTKMERTTVNLILKNPQTNPNVRFGDGMPFVIKALLGNNTDLIDKLLQDPRVDFNIRDNKGCTILYHVLLKRKPVLVNELLRNKKVDPNVCTNDGKLIFDEVINYDLERNPGTTPDPLNPNTALYLLLNHPKVTKADRNAYKLYLAMSERRWDAAQIILKEQEINIHLKDFITLAVLNDEFEIFKDLLRRGGIPKENLLFNIAKKNNRKFALSLFDATIDFDPYNPEGRLVLKVLFPNWEWDLLLDAYNGNIEDLLNNPIERSSFIKMGAQHANPLELLIVFPNPKFYIDYTSSLTENEQSQYLGELKKILPNKCLFLSLETQCTPPEKPKRNLPDIDQFSLEKAVSLYKKFYNFINFIDPKKNDYVHPDMIFDQGKKCSAEELRGFGEGFCLYMNDPANSKYAQERTDSHSYQNLRVKFRYVMYHMAEQDKRLKEDKTLTDDEKIAIKKNIDKMLMLIASSGNHCLLAKNDVLEEGLDKAFGIAYIPTLANQISHILHRYRLGVIETIFTNFQTDPPEILSHEMYAFMITYEKEIGVIVDDLVRDDPFLQGVILMPEFLSFYLARNRPENLCQIIAKELQGGGEVSQKSFKQWLSENPPENWSQFDELLYDVERMSSDMGYAYLYRNFSISPTPEEMLEMANVSDEKIHIDKFKEITQQVNEEYQSMYKEKELEIKRRQKSLEGTEGPLVAALQGEINRLRLDLPLLSAKKIQEQYRKKMSYLQTHGIFLEPTEYLLALKRKEDFSVIKIEMEGNPIEDQWRILEKHNIYRIAPLEALMQSDKEGEENDSILREMSEKLENEQWKILARHNISNPNPKTPLEALEKYRAQQYANQSYVDGIVRVDRIIPLLMFARQLQVPMI